VFGLDLVFPGTFDSTCQFLMLGPV
jgi:hypothetical protein